jgi:hypothetical protein
MNIRGILALVGGLGILDGSSRPGLEEYSGNPFLICEKNWEKIGRGIPALWKDIGERLYEECSRNLRDTKPSFSRDFTRPSQA